jgi:hypothetical protein
MGSEIVAVAIFFVMAVLCAAIARLFSHKRSHVIAGTALLLIGSDIAYELIFRGHLKHISFESFVIVFTIAALLGFLVTRSAKKGGHP